MKWWEVNKEDMVTCELEAAEALAGLARFSGEVSDSGESERSREELVTEAAITSSTRPSQDQTIAAEQFCGYRNEQSVETINSQQCSTSYKPNFVSKLRPKLTEAEKEARRHRRVLANRESARQTIRRRQAMYLELTTKAADVLEENGNLKKEKELALKEYNSLKDRNEFLKAEMAKIKKADQTQEDPKTSQADISSSSSAPVFPHNHHPSLVPYFWPSTILPYSDDFQFQYSSHYNNASQFPRPEIPLFVVPVPWLLPCLTLGSHNSDTNPHKCSTCSCSDTLLHDNDNNNHLSSNQNPRAEVPNSTKPMHLPPVGRDGNMAGMGRVWRNPMTSVWARDPPRPNSNQYTGHHPRGHESIRHGLSRKSKEPIVCPPKKPEVVFAAIEARKKRKELMKLKNTNNQHD